MMKAIAKDFNNDLERDLDGRFFTKKQEQKIRCLYEVQAES